MKPSGKITALLLAIALHILPAALLWFLMHPESQEEHPKREKRFGVLISEEPSPAETPEPPFSPETLSDAPSSIPLMPKPRMQPQPSPDTGAFPEPEKKADVEQITPEQRDTLARSILYHYGETFFELSAGEQHYIIDNLQRIRKINEIVGTRLLREREGEEIDPSDSNIVEFTLHPDGSVSDLFLHKNRVGTFLDELTLQTISLAHPRYPKPDQPTLIRIRVYIVVK